MKAVIKKFSWLAVIAVAMIFTSCDKNGTEEPEIIVFPGNYGWIWRLDSIHSEEDIPCPSAIIRVLSSSSALINGDTVTYSYNDNKLICGDVEYVVITATKDYAVLSDQTTFFYLSECRLFYNPYYRLNDAIPANVVGKWKLVYYVSIPSDVVSHVKEGDYYTYMRTRPGVEIWHLKKDGNATYHNYLTGDIQNGIWEHIPSCIKDNYVFPTYINFVNNPEGEGQSIGIVMLTKELMMLRTQDENWDTQYHFIRVK